MRCQMILLIIFAVANKSYFCDSTGLYLYSAILLNLVWTLAKTKLHKLYASTEFFDRGVNVQIIIVYQFGIGAIDFMNFTGTVTLVPR